MLREIRAATTALALELGVVVYALVEAPAWLPDGDDYLVRPVADWVADSKHEPADIAGDVMRCCRVTSRRVA